MKRTEFTIKVKDASTALKSIFGVGISGIGLLLLGTWLQLSDTNPELGQLLFDSSTYVVLALLPLTLVLALSPKWVTRAKVKTIVLTEQHLEYNGNRYLLSDIKSAYFFEGRNETLVSFTVFLSLFSSIRIQTAGFSTLESDFRTPLKSLQAALIRENDKISTSNYVQLYFLASCILFVLALGLYSGFA